jgi:hypothetical protein
MSRGFAVLFERQGARVGAIVAGDMNTTDSALAERFRGRTREGIGIGSTRSEVVTAFGGGRSRRDEGRESLGYRERGLDLVLLDGKVRWLSVRAPDH